LQGREFLVWRGGKFEYNYPIMGYEYEEWRSIKKAIQVSLRREIYSEADSVLEQKAYG
jgi:hypothetical protein